MEGKYGRQVATLIRKGQFSTGSTKSIENITLEQVKAAAQNYSTFYLPQHQYSLEFHEDYARDKSLQLTANYTGPTYQSASGLRHQWSWREYIPFYWNVAEAQQEANRLATETVGPIAVHQASTFCMCCCRSRRLAKAKAKTQEIEREYNTKYEPIFTKNINAIAPEWTALHVAFLVKKFDQELNEFIATPGTVQVADEGVSFHISLSPVAARSPPRGSLLLESTSDAPAPKDSEKLLGE